jgi:outer membrane receptor protein involved in Fe transport
VKAMKGTLLETMTSLRGLLSIAVAIVLASRAPVWGQELPDLASTTPEASELDLFKLDALLNAPVVTSSGGVEEERSLASANVFTISREEIAVHGWRSLAEALANAPGLYVNDDLVFPSLGVRGVTGGINAGTRVVKVMIDGQAVSFRPDLTAFLGPEYIPMDAVERIEVVKGPLSALYGANAFIATVNVITRKAAPNLSADVGARLNVFNGVGYGGSGLVSYEGKNSGLLAAFSLDQISRSGLKLQLSFPRQDGAADIFQRTSQHDSSSPMSGFLRFHVGSERFGTLTLEGGFQRLDAAGEFQVNSILTEQTRVALLNIWTNARYEKTWKKGAFNVTLGYSQGNPTRDYELVLTGNNAYSFKPNEGYKAVDIAVQGTYSPFGERLSLQAGLDFEYSLEDVLFYTQTYRQPEGLRQTGDSIDLIGPTTSRDESYYDIGVSLQATSVPFKRLPGLHLTGNIRVDKIAFGPVHFPTELSWRAAAAYRWNRNWVTKIIGGRAFQTPSGVTLFGHPGFGNANNIVGNVVVPGLPPLRPQVVNSVEVVATGQLFNHLGLEVGAYYQNLQDAIEFVQTGVHFTAANQGVRNVVGLEATLRFTYRWLSAYGIGSVEGVLADGKFDENPPPLFPRGVGVIGADADITKLHLHANAQVRIVGPRGASQSNVLLNDNRFYELPTYAILDVTLSTVDLNLFGPHFETKILASGRNLLDHRTPDPGFAGIDLPRLGRAFLVEVRQKF